jgi:hypothetical protein
MARRRHNDRTLYLVNWREAGVVKIGFTDHLHRRRKAMPAGELILALTFPDSLVGYDFEIAANQAAFRAWPRAFDRRADAIAFLPPFGRGYLECYQTTPADALELIASQCHVTFNRHDVTLYRDDTSERHTVTSRSYGRTDGLTETRGFRDGKIFRYVTHARAGRISRFVTQGRAS